METSYAEGDQKWQGPEVWDGRTLARDDDWFMQLTEAEIGELREAVDAVRSTAKPFPEMTLEDFPLPTLHNRLSKLRADITSGKGFAVIRGLPDWEDEDLVRAYWGIGMWFGNPVTQNAAGHLLGHVIDQRAADDSKIRPYQTNKAQPFHSDSCDIVGLLCLRAAKSGGESSIASSAAIRNYLLEHDKPAFQRLHDEFYCDRFGEIPEGKLPFYKVRIFNYVDDKLVVCGMDPDIRAAQRLDEVPDLSRDDLHALDAFQKAGARLSLNMMLKRGDIQLVNNHVVQHARASFDDHESLDRRRYLVRLWLSSPEGRKLPTFMAERWGNIEAGTVRGGIVVPGAIPVVQLDPSK